MTCPSLLPPKKVAFFTLGCKLNFAETSHIGKQLMEAGYTKARSGEEADICIVNTCTVTDAADRKCRQAIHRLHREYPHAIMIVTGCYAQLKPQEIAAIEGVNLVLGSHEKFNILEYLQTFENQSNSQIFHSKQQELKTFHPSCSYEDRTRYFLKIQDGCDYYCTYCTIPFARGRSRNGSISEIITLAEKAISEGAKEIVLTGVNVGDFGKSTGESFFNLLKALDNLPYEIRFRISSVEPDLLSDEIIKWIAQSRHFMPHFHIPLQSGSNEILRIMRRRYNTELFASKIDTIKKWMPNA
ncbi:MAG TPA: MiaB/RimO family radical SAM methylthiotransferase, partial [Paludibacteraceae bacterium]|nr:MiaB/RimO family radical SAM methylthiotransferase [Paludibacteraceae bacterium]